MKLSTRFMRAVTALLTFAVFFSATLVAAPTSYAAEPVVVGQSAVVTNTDGDTIRVRQGAGGEFKQVAEAHEGQTVAVTDGPSRDSKGYTWYKVQMARGVGWMRSDFLKGKGTSAAAPKAASQESRPAAQPAANLSGFGRVTNTDGDRLRVRSAANRSGKVITTFAPNTSVAIKAGPVVDGEKITWYQISANGITGWAMAEYLEQAQAPVEPAAPAVALAPAVQSQSAQAEQPKPAAPAPAPAPVAPQPAVETAKEAQPQTADSRSVTSRGPQPPDAVEPSSMGQTIVSIAMRYNGARYRFGASGPNSFDCSGFLYYVVNKAGKRIARTIPGQISAGTRVSSKELQPGDLVFFSNTYKRGLSHAGIYIGNGKFIHAQNESTGVLISSLWSAYWVSHYTTAVRLR